MKRRSHGLLFTRATVARICSVAVIASMLNLAPATAASRAPTVRSVSSDVIVDGYGTSSGYHVAVGRATGGYRLRDVAVIDPAGLDAGSWVGYQCVSGDGKFAAVAVLPGNLSNDLKATARGAFAYSVDLATGRVRAVAAGVGLSYFSPGCGTGDDAVFTLNPTGDETSTELLKADLSNGKVTENVRSSGQLTSAVPVGSSIDAVAGGDVVAVPAKGRLRVLASATGEGYDLRPSAEGGLTYLTVASADAPTAVVRHLAGSGRVQTLASGPRMKVALMQGASGRAVLVGARSSSPLVTVASAAKLPLGATTASLRGRALLGNARGRSSKPLLTVGAAAAVAVSRRPSSRPASQAVATYVPVGALADFTSTPKRRSAAAVESVGRASVSAASAQTPTCAVGRLTSTTQVLQPSIKQIDWAAQMAEQGLLTGGSYTRPAGYANLGLAAYAPSSDFPVIRLSHPSGSSTSTVPRSVFEAIMAQESNWSQASWHAPQGVSGDPLIADYYGAAGDIASIDYADADCGYGIGQVTTGMHVGDSLYSSHGQLKIAVDYEENIAAGLNILENIWNQLYADGITDNNADPEALENWFDAAWAYNSGIQPTGKYNTTGCAPGPSCTGPDGTWGLGWANNPANPQYPPNRDPYLQDTYADAAHPANWPYEERIMGWMASPIVRYGSKAYAKPTYNGGSTWIQIPPHTAFCSLSQNDCNPTATNPTTTDAGHCMLGDYECWWHSKVTWVAACSSTCATSSYTTSGGSEPSDPDPDPPTCSLDTTQVPSNSIIVDDQASPNADLVGCSSGNENWTSNGTFTYAYGTNSAGDPVGAIDTHQLGTGLGGHILFSHTEDGSNSALINTGTWTPNLPSLQYYDVKVHLPSLGATATNVVYSIYPGGGASPYKVRVNQAWSSERWVSLGTFPMENGGSVVLTNKSASVQSGSASYTDYDVAWDAVAFAPKGGPVTSPLGGSPTIMEEPAGSNPAVVQCGCEVDVAGDPVNTATGYYGDTWTDLSTPGRGAALNFTRTYASGLADPSGPNATATINGPFGYGWSYSYGLSATTDASGNVTVHQEDGSTVGFTSASGAYTPTTPRADATLTRAGSTYTYTRRGDAVFFFDTTTGRLTGETDFAGLNASPSYRTSLTYNSSGQLSTITDPAGRAYTLTWSAGHITKLVDTAGRTVTYAYSGGNLTGVYGVGSIRSPTLANNDLTSYSYNTKHLITAFRTPANQGKAASAQTAMTYSSDRVVTQSDPDGRTTSFAYGPSSGLSTGQTLITDPAGDKTLDTYQNGLLASQTRGYGTSSAGTWTYAHDPVSLGISQITDPDGHVTTYTYDAHGNRTSASDAEGNTTNYLYDSHDDLTETVSPNGVATVNLYDQAGHIATTSGANDGSAHYGDLTSTTVTQANNVVESITGNFGPAPTRTTSYYYDDKAHPGDRTRVVDSLGNTTTSTYDSPGDLTSVTDPLGNTTKYGYDTRRGLLTSTVTAIGVSKGVSVSCTPPAAGCTTFAHDAYGNTTRTTNPLGASTSATYDPDGHETSATDADGDTTTTTYDPAGQPTKVTQADQTTLTDTYTPDGHVASTTNASGATTKYTYDAQGNQLTSTDPDKHTTKHTYDPAGELLTTTNPAGQTTTYTRDPDGRDTAITYSDGATANTTNISYDPDGQRTGTTDSTGTSTWTYDTFGELVASANGAGEQTSYGYDNDGDQTSITYPNGQTLSKTYNQGNELATLTDWLGGSTTFGYDADGDVTSEALTSGVTSRKTYDNADQLATITDAKGSTTIAAFTATRDALGQVLKQTATGAVQQSRAYSYDKLHRLTADSGSGYQYDKANNLTANANTTQAFDTAGQLTSTKTGSATTTYAYNADGDRTSSTTSGVATTLTYNQADELTSAPGASYTYDTDGLRATKTTSQSTSHYAWDESQSTALLLSDDTASYIYGPDGAPIEQITGTTATYLLADTHADTRLLLSATGAVTGTYSYNAWGATTSHTGTATTPLRYNGQYTDAETGYIYLRARYYDPATGQFLTVDPLISQTGTAYAYAGDAPTNLTDPTGTSWYNPTSWSSSTWINVGLTGLSAAELALALGTDAPEVAAQDAAIVAGEDTATDVASGGVYSLQDEDGTIVRTGRTSDLDERRLQHLRDPILSQFDFNIEARTDDYATQRGLEQQLYDANPQARIENGGYNKIRAIRLDNPRYEEYMDAADEFSSSSIGEIGSCF